MKPIISILALATLAACSQEVCRSWANMPPQSGPGSWLNGFFRGVGSACAGTDVSRSSRSSSVVITNNSENSCDIVQITNTNIIVPIGKYRSTVSRVEQDLYQIQGTDAYVKTQYCYEYALSQDVIIEIDSTVGITIGTIYFLD